jgi:hypothetical protein
MVKRIIGQKSQESQIIHNREYIDARSGILKKGKG